MSAQRHHKRDDGGRNQDQNHDILKLIQKALQQRFFLLAFRALGPKRWSRS